MKHVGSHSTARGATLLFVTGFSISTLLRPSIAAPDTKTHAVSQENATLSITIMVVDNLQRRPVPLADFQLVAMRGAAHLFRTDKQGQFKFLLPVGDYTLNSVKPLPFKGQTLIWRVPIHLIKGLNKPLVFTNAEAVNAASSTRLVPVSRLASLPSSLAEGTKLRLELTEAIESDKAKPGDEVHLTLKDDVVDEHKTVLIKSGAIAVGHITAAKKAKSFGRKGKLEFAIDSVAAIDGTKIPLRSTQTGKKNNMLSGAVKMLFAGPLMGFVKGKNITINPGTIFEAYIDKTVSLKAAASIK